MDTNVLLAGLVVLLVLFKVVDPVVIAFLENKRSRR